MKAVIDIGSNSVLLLVGQRDASGRVDVVDDDARIARLSEGVSKTGLLSDAAINRTLEILAEYRRRAEAAGAVIEAVATEGLRMAGNQAAFLDQAHRVLGSRVRMISGDEEARLSYLSVAREEPDGGPMRVVDIGGASTELAVGQGEALESVVSHKIGSVRLTEQHVRSDPPTTVELDAVAAEARRALSAQPLEPAPEVYGLAGTVTTAAALLLELDSYDRERIDGSRFTAAQIRSLRERLGREPLDIRARRPCLPPGRADVILAGLTILLEVLEHCGAGTLVVRDRGLRYALV